MQVSDRLDEYERLAALVWDAAQRMDVDGNPDAYDVYVSADVIRHLVKEIRQIQNVNKEVTNVHTN